MYNLKQHLHLVGIGGVGMAGIAEVLLSQGYAVSGSDIRENQLIVRLKELGAEVCIGHGESNISADVTVLVISSAVGEDNPEVIVARERGIPVIKRAEMLAELMRGKYGIAIAGSHGKTTTTSLTAKILGDSGFDPSVIIGGKIRSLSSGAKLGSGQFMLVEADESDGSFSYLRPAVSVITNIDREHLSHYGSMGKLEETFYEFMASIPFYGLVVACFDDLLVMQLAKKCERRICSYGISRDCDVSARDIRIEEGVSSFSLCLSGEEKAQIALPLSGEHMVRNALAAAAVCLELGVYPQEIAESLSDFPGVSRRAEVLYQDNNVMFIDDYAHHPTEIEATLRAVRKSWISASGKYNNLVALFQPHRYSRVRDLYSEFLNCFDAADRVCVVDVHCAGEKEIEGVNAQELARAINCSDVRYLANFEENIEDFLASLSKGTVVLAMGAGSIASYSQQIASRLKKPA